MITIGRINRLHVLLDVSGTGTGTITGTGTGMCTGTVAIGFVSEHHDCL